MKGFIVAATSALLAACVSAYVAPTPMVGTLMGQNHAIQAQPTFFDACLENCLQNCRLGSGFGVIRGVSTARNPIPLNTLGGQPGVGTLVAGAGNPFATGYRVGLTGPSAGYTMASVSGGTRGLGNLQSQGVPEQMMASQGGSLGSTLTQITETMKTNQPSGQVAVKG